LLDGPAGCWELAGRASWSWDAGRFGGSRGDAAFVGRIQDGIWQDFHIEPLGERSTRDRMGVLVYGDEQRFVPLVGQVPGGFRSGRRDRDDLTPGNVVRGALDELGGEAETAYVQWDVVQDAVVLVRTVPIGDQRQAPLAEASTWFPGGAQSPRRLDRRFPPRFTSGGFPKYSVHDARVEIRARAAAGTLFPEAEAASFEARWFGLSFQGKQSLAYQRATPCGGLAPAPTAPAMEDR
jgi:hypothetical protein